MKEILIRLMVGGLVVSMFAWIGDMLKPKSFAGLFGGAPSVALATLALTAMTDGRTYASIEARSMLLGAIALCLYAWCVSQLLLRRRLSIIPATAAPIIVWMVCAFGLWYALSRVVG